MIATASVAGALATAELMTEYGLGGKVVVFGTPAEEGIVLSPLLAMDPMLSIVQAAEARSSFSKRAHTPTTAST